MEVKASLRHARIGTQKARPVADLVRGKDVNDAIRILTYMNKKAAGMMKKLIESAVANAEDKTVIDMKLEYFNASSPKCLLDFFKRLEKLNGNKTDVQVNWYFEKDDEDMAEAGEDYEAIVSLPFKIIEVEEIY